MAVYSEVLRVHLIRKKHHVVFMPGESPAALVSELQKVPLSALVDEVTTSDAGITTIVFHDETAEPK
jgi:hypothetical protein